MKEVIDLIENFGFPIALVIYLFTRFEKRFIKVIKSVEELENLLKKLLHKKKKNKGERIKWQIKDNI